MNSESQAYQQQRLAQLVFAIKRGNLEEMANILAENPAAIVNKFYNDPAERYPPLHFAVFFPREDVGLQMVKLLLQNGADPAYKDLYNQTILYYIAREGREQIGKLLLDSYRLNINHTDGEHQTPIYYAAREQKLGMIELLVKHGANINHKDKNHQTCLFYAAREGRLEACKLLVQLGIDVQHQDKKKKNAAWFARQRNQKHVVDYLNSLKTEDKKTKEIEKARQNKDSSMTEKKKLKKDAPKSEYVLIFTDNAGNVHQLDEAEIEEFKKHHEKLYNLMENPDLLAEQATSSAMYQQKAKFLKIANRILTNCSRSKHGYLFSEPVDPIKLNIPDYFTIVRRPMDFSTVKTKLNNNAYENHSNFVQDMLLVLDNCILYNGTENAVGKAALELKFQLNNMIKQFYQV